MQTVYRFVAVGSFYHPEAWPIKGKGVTRPRSALAADTAGVVFEMMLLAESSLQLPTAAPAVPPTLLEPVAVARHCRKCRRSLSP